MGCSQTQISSGFDERKRKRMISNRESARRSRMKKQQRVDELFGEMSELQRQNKVVVEKINQATDMFVGVASENNVLRAQLSELSDRLYSLNTVLSIVEEVSGLAMDIPHTFREPWKIPDAFMEPWQQQQPITASADMFNC